jgi:hypothetical protein
MQSMPTRTQKADHANLRATTDRRRGADPGGRDATGDRRLGRICRVDLTSFLHIPLGLPGTLHRKPRWSGGDQEEVAFGLEQALVSAGAVAAVDVVCHRFLM